jgi:hypothetical protein
MQEAGKVRVRCVYSSVMRRMVQATFPPVLSNLYLYASHCNYTHHLATTRRGLRCWQ